MKQKRIWLDQAARGVREKKKMWKKKYTKAVGLCLLFAGLFLSQALYHLIVHKEAASPGTATLPATFPLENNTAEESLKATCLPMHADEPTQKKRPLPAAKPTTSAFANRVRQAQTKVESALKDSLTDVSPHQPDQELIPPVGCSVNSEFPAFTEKTTKGEAAAVMAIAQIVNASTIENVQIRTPLSAVVVPLLLTQVGAEALSPSMQPADSGMIADVLSQTLAEQTAQLQPSAKETPSVIEAETLSPSRQPAESSMIAVVHVGDPLASAVVQPPSSQAAVSVEAEAGMFSALSEDAATIQVRDRKPMNVIAQNRADVDEERVFEDILNLIKSKMVLNQSNSSAHPEPAIVLTSLEPGRKTAAGPQLVQQTQPARHGIGVAIGTVQPNMAEKIRIPVFSEVHYRYQSTQRTQLHVAAGAAPLLWPGGRTTMQIFADLIGSYDLLVHRRIQPNFSLGLGMLSTRRKSGPSFTSGILLAGGGVNMALAQQWNFGVQVQYKYCLQNPASAGTTRRGGYLQIKTELTFSLRQLSPIRLESEENYLAEKQ
ncbi:hypothetical protein GX408_05565 [bacterium]|nr:hypothetical protein [bacterium]